MRPGLTNGARMKIGVLGTGMVGRAIATALVGAGYEVMMGSRSAGNEAAVAWSSEAGDAGSKGTFADAAAFGELAFNCTAGAGAREAVGSASAELEGKVLIDVSNPLEFPGGSPTLFVGIADSLGEQGVRLHPWPPRHRPPARRSRGPLRLPEGGLGGVVRTGANRLPPRVPRQARFRSARHCERSRRSRRDRAPANQLRPRGSPPRSAGGGGGLTAARG